MHTSKRDMSNIYRKLPTVNQVILHKSVKGEIIQPNRYRLLPKVNQGICTLDTIFVLNIRILLQAVLQIFCWQGSISLQCISRKRGIIQSNIHRILRKVNQVFCTIYQNSMPDIWASSRDNLSSGFATRVDSNRPVQPQKLGRDLKFRI